MLPYYCERYPQILAAVKPTAELLRTLPTLSETKHNLPPGHFEMEMRFGTFGHQRDSFVAGVGADFVRGALSLFQQYEDWHKVTAWTEIVDYFYDMPGTQTQTRTSVSVNPETGKWTTQHIRKHPRGTVDMLFLSDYVPKLYDIRTRLCYEEEVSVSSLPNQVQPVSVRIKQRKQYFYGREKGQAPLWCYDLTRSWAGATKAEAEEKQKKGLTTYEIELECLNVAAYMQYHRQDEIFAATSMLLKMTRLYDLEDNNFYLEARL